jgi:histidine ammonia-lyase
MTALRIGDEPLTPAAVAAAARDGGLRVALTDGARERLDTGRRTADAVAARRPVYGFTTGVGANRHVGVEGDLREHALRLLRSHAGGVGDELPEEVVRATVLVRVAQLAAGGSGIRPQVAEALAGLLGGTLPAVRDLGGIGTGDLTVLAQLGLALAGGDDEAIGPGDALPLLSSNAATFATAVLAWDELSELLDAGLGVAAVTFAALRGNAEAFAAPLAAARPLPGLAATSARLRALTGGAGPPARIQDPFALRCLPQVAGALHGALAALHDVLAVEINAAAENPLFAGGDALHHGGFHAAGCALALDGLRLAVVPFGALAQARLAHLMEPELTGLTPFLAGDAPGSSGAMIAEYLAGDALARLRAEAAPAVLGSIAISRGLEEHASFAWQAAGQARRAAGHLGTLLALEWVAAERALRMREASAEGATGEGATGAAPALAPARELARGLGAGLEDRPLGDDVARARAALPGLATAVRATGEPLH